MAGSVAGQSGSPCSTRSCWSSSPDGGGAEIQLEVPPETLSSRDVGSGDRVRYLDLAGASTEAVPTAVMTARISACTQPATGVPKM